MPWIARCSLKDIQCGTHIEPSNCILIQIVDICREFPEPYFKNLFLNIHQFEFEDVEEIDSIIGGISNQQAIDISKILLYALKNNQNILVHCIAGVSRSGGVCEAAEMFGFSYIRYDKMNTPNIMVKSKIKNALMGTYD